MTDSSTQPKPNSCNGTGPRVAARGAGGAAVPKSTAGRARGGWRINGGVFEGGRGRNTRAKLESLDYV